MTMKRMRELEAEAEEIMQNGTFNGMNGNTNWQNNFYVVNGYLVNIQYHNGRLYDIINYGRC